MKAHVFVSFGVHAARNDYGNVLLRHSHVGTEASGFRQRNQALRRLDALEELVDNDFELARLLHNAAKHHGDDGEGNGVHHIAETAGREKIINCSDAGVGLEAAVSDVQDVAKAGALEDWREDSTQDDAHEDAGNSRHFFSDENDNREWWDQKYRRNGEGCREAISHGADGGEVNIGTTIAHAEDSEENEGNGVCNNRWFQHELDVGEDVRAGHGRREVGRVGKRRHLIAEVGAGDDRAGRDWRRDAKARGNAHKCYADGSCSAPARSGRQGSNGRYEERRNEEDLWREDAESVIDHGRNNAGKEPDANEDAYDREDDNGLKCLTDAVKHVLLDVIPFVSDPKCHQCRKRDANQHWDVRIRAVDRDPDSHGGDQQCKGGDGFVKIRHSCFHFSPPLDSILYL